MAEKYPATCRNSDGPAEPCMKSQQTDRSEAPEARTNNRREYQRSLSKQRMKVTRYRASGTIHRKGMTATSRHTRLVVASSITEGTIASPNHNPTRFHERPSSGSHVAVPQGLTGAASGTARRHIATAQTPHSRAKPRNMPDHSQDWAKIENAGSTTNGY